MEFGLLTPLLKYITPFVSDKPQLLWCRLKNKAVPLFTLGRQKITIATFTEVAIVQKGEGRLEAKPPL